MLSNKKNCKHSIWLSPSNAAFELLQQRIEMLTEHSGTPVFTPHMTLLGGIEGDPERTAELCKRAFAQCGTLNASITALSRTEKFFMSFFVDLDVPANVLSARSAIAVDLGFVAATPFRPHISLAYGIPASQPDPSEVVAIKQQLIGRNISLGGICVVASDDTIAIEDWTVLWQTDL